MTSGNGPLPHRRRSLRPHRDSALVYGVLAVLVVGVTVLTGGRVLLAVILGALAFALAMGWTWWRLRAREEERRR